MKEAMKNKIGFVQAHPHNPRIKSLIGKILANISLHKDYHLNLFRSWPCYSLDLFFFVYQSRLSHFFYFYVKVNRKIAYIESWWFQEWLGWYPGLVEAGPQPTGQPTRHQSSLQSGSRIWPAQVSNFSVILSPSYFDFGIFYITSPLIKQLRSKQCSGTTQAST